MFWDLRYRSFYSKTGSRFCRNAFQHGEWNMAWIVSPPQKKNRFCRKMKSWLWKVPKQKVSQFENFPYLKNNSAWKVLNSQHPPQGPVASDLDFDWSSPRFDRSSFGSCDPDVSATLLSRGLRSAFRCSPLTDVDWNCVTTVSHEFENLNLS